MKAFFLGVFLSVLGYAGLYLAAGAPAPAVLPVQVQGGHVSMSGQLMGSIVFYAEDATTGEAVRVPVVLRLEVAKGQAVKDE